MDLVTAYLDESGTHSGSMSTVVAGYVSTAPRWLEFEREWAALLDSFSIGIVHGKDLEQSSKAFRGWSRDKKNEFVRQLLEPIKKYVLYGSIVALINKDYDEVFVDMPPKARMDSKYGLCFRKCVVKIGSFVREKYPGERISFVLEDGHKNKGDAIRLFELSKKTPVSKARWPLGSLAFATKDDYGALQAADLIAYHSYRQMVAFVEAGATAPVDPLTATVLALYRSVSYNDFWINREEMQVIKLQSLFLHARNKEWGRRTPK